MSNKDPQAAIQAAEAAIRANGQARADTPVNPEQITTARSDITAERALAQRAFHDIGIALGQEPGMDIEKDREGNLRAVERDSDGLDRS